MQQLATTRSGEVIAAADESGQFTTRVVVKTVSRSHRSDEAMKIAAYEAATARRLQQAGVPALVESLVRPDRGQLYIVNQRVPGVSLAELIEARRQHAGRGFDERVVASVGLALLRILHSTHTHVEGPVVHRDISTRSVMVDRLGRVWLLDGGLPSAAIARWRGSRTDLRGTLGFSAPEQQAGEHIDALTDLYSVASVLYGAATLSTPARAQASSHRPPWMSDELWRVIAKGLADERAQRWGSAADFVLALAARCTASERTHSIETLRASVADLDVVPSSTDRLDARTEPATLRTATRPPRPHREATPPAAVPRPSRTGLTPPTHALVSRPQASDIEATVEYPLPPDLDAIFGLSSRIGRGTDDRPTYAAPIGPVPPGSASAPHLTLVPSTAPAVPDTPRPQRAASDVHDPAALVASPRGRMRAELILSSLALLAAIAAIALR
jgi:serine/threonine protein kinase